MPGLRGKRFSLLLNLKARMSMSVVPQLWQRSHRLGLTDYFMEVKHWRLRMSVCHASSIAPSCPPLAECLVAMVWSEIEHTEALKETTIEPKNLMEKRRVDWFLEKLKCGSKESKVKNTLDRAICRIRPIYLKWWEGLQHGFLEIRNPPKTL